MWRDEGAWIAIGISLVFVLAAVVMHRVFIKILKQRPPDGPKELSKDE